MGLHLSRSLTTYDRRGLSRSTLDDPAQRLTVEAHADGVHRLLASLTDEPALMLGCSLGAVIGFHLALRHPGQVSTLIAHEPVAPRLLPDAERTLHEQELRETQEIYRSYGLPVVIKVVAKLLGINLADQEAEPSLTQRPFTPERGVMAPGAPHPRCGATLS
jgi:pimeloyl-ACP methyl ester carboxylesterase